MEHTIRQLHVFPPPTAPMAGLAEGKKRPTLITCPPRCSTLLVSRACSLPSAASEKERASADFEKPLEVEVFDPDNPVAIGQSGRQLVEQSSLRQVMR